MIKQIEGLFPHELVFDLLFLHKKFTDGISVLQTGVKHKPHGVSNWKRMFDYFELFGYKNFDVLEVWKENLSHLPGFPIRNRILGDVKDIEKLVKNQYDVIFWWHGPEHLTKQEFTELQISFNLFSNTLIVIGCPWGKFEQGIVDGNPYEEHKHDWEPEELENLGYEVFKTVLPRRRDLIGIKYIS